MLTGAMLSLFPEPPALNLYGKDISKSWEEKLPVFFEVGGKSWHLTGFY